MYIDRERETEREGGVPGDQLDDELDVDRLCVKRSQRLVECFGIQGYVLVN